MTAKSPELYRGNIITSRVRLARNLEGHPFTVKDPKLAKGLVKREIVISCTMKN